jgi:hypothetical protein
MRPIAQEAYREGLREDEKALKAMGFCVRRIMHQYKIILLWRID